MTGTPDSFAATPEACAAPPAAMRIRNAAGEGSIDYWADAGTWAAMPDERRQNTMAMLPPVAHEWDMATSGLRPLEGWRAVTEPRSSDLRGRHPHSRAIVELLEKTYPDWHVHEVASGGHMAPLVRPDIHQSAERCIDRRDNPLSAGVQRR